MSLITYPLNDIDYTAEDAELFHCTRSSGVYAKDAFKCTCTGTNNTITIGPGIAWIRNSDFSGKVVALKSNLNLSLNVPDATYPRIDTVVLLFNASTNKSSIGIRAGTAASSPVATSRNTSASLYELHLFHIRREPGATAVTAADITDLRLDSKYCGLMADSVTSIDTSAINSQVKSLLSRLEKEIESRLESVDNSLNNNSQGVPIPTVNQAGFFIRATAAGTAYELVDLINLHIWKKYTANPAMTETTKTGVDSTSVVNANANLEYADEISVVDGVISLVNPKTVKATSDDALEAAILGKYIYAPRQSAYCFVPENATAGARTVLSTNTYYVSPLVVLAAGGEKVGLIADPSRDAYPDNGEHTDGFWYEYHKQLGE